MTPKLYSVFSLIFILMLPLPAQGLGITPARTVVDFEPGATNQLTFRVFNKDSSQKNVELYVKGEMKDYITLPSASITVPPAGSATFTASFALPQSLSGGGIHEARVGAAELVRMGDSNLQARIAVEAQFWVNVPGEGQDANLILDIQQTADEIKALVTVNNIGTGNFTAPLTLDILSQGNIVRSFSFTIDVPPGKNKQVRQHIPFTDLGEGSFLARATLSFNSTQRHVERPFTIGTADAGSSLSITNIAHGQVHRNMNAPIDITVKNALQRTVTVAMTIDISRNGMKIGSPAAGSITLNPGEEKTHSIDWDTTGLAAGTYTLTFRLSGDGVSTSWTETIDILEPGAEAKTLLYFIVPAVLAFLLVVTLLIRRSRQGKPQTSPETASAQLPLLAGQ